MTKDDYIKAIRVNRPRMVRIAINYLKTTDMADRFHQDLTIQELHRIYIPFLGSGYTPGPDSLDDKLYRMETRVWITASKKLGLNGLVRTLGDSLTETGLC